MHRGGRFPHPWEMISHLLSNLVLIMNDLLETRDEILSRQLSSIMTVFEQIEFLEDLMVFLISPAIDQYRNIRAER
jgi:hypothetical protein